ncbi:MAG: YihA family ribosome biogenesis GTP-binding protein [Mycoplasmataceae bacterium]|nr:YihA family ribosome biogenesis GTP-binding protein [Mycoplasmataceae bacterium]
MLINVKYILTTHDMNLMPHDDIPEYVIVGKSNVGKSTFINSITNIKKLAYVSGKPGKTRAISLFDVGGNFRLVDIPGYGYAKVSFKQKEMFADMIDTYLSKRKNIKKIILLIDCRRGITKDDREMMKYIVYHQLSFSVIGTKLDKINQSKKIEFLRNVKKELNTVPLMYSSLKKNNIKDIIKIFNF